MIFKNKSKKAKDILIISIGVFDVLLFIVYKIFLSKDGYDFNIWKELPLQLCNINMFLIPLSVILNNKYLKSFGFYVGPLAAIMAMSFPEAGFYDNSIFLMRNVGFYGTHAIIVVMGVLLLTLGYIKLSFKDIINLLIITVILSLSIFVVNIILFKLTGVETNYFFTMNPSTVSLLHLFYKLIPIKYLYLLPAAGILIVYVVVINSIKLVIDKIK
jgi:uncharacterized membrane protein YwaF